MFEHIVVATDLAPDAEPAVEMAVGLAQRDQADLTIVHVFEIPASMYPGAAFSPVDLLGPLQDTAQQQLEAIVAKVRDRWPRTRGVFRTGVAWEAILGAAQEARADLVVTGTHGRRGISHAVLGSVAEKIVRLCPVPVLTVRQPHRSAR